MPALSPTMEKGTIVHWCKKEGDAVSTGDILFEVETDKATVGYEVQDDGFLAKILVDAGTSDVPVGQPVAIIVEEEENIAALQGADLTENQQKEPEVQQQQQVKQQEQKPAKSYPDHSKISMPSLSPTMTSGKVKEWLKKEGDFLVAGDILCEIETDKASMGFEIQDEGYLAKIVNKDVGVEMNVGDVIAIVVDEETDIAQFKEFDSQDLQAPASQDVVQESPEVQKQTETTQAQNDQVQKGQRIFASPLAQKMAKERNYNLAEISGSGPSGRIIKNDIESFTPTQESKPAPQQVAQEKPVKKEAKKAVQPKVSQDENPYDEIPLSNMRKTIANRLLESKTTIPHYYVTKTVTMDESLKLRAILNQEEGVKVSVNDMLIKAAGLACLKTPDVNSQWHGDHIKKFHNCDVSVAVSTDAGLITPIVFGANSKGLGEISKNVKELAGKARKGALKPEEYIGGTFTISNLGMFGVDHFSAIINPPQACIMAVGKTEKKVVFDATNSEVPYKVVSQMTVTLSCDHRVVDGAVAAEWLNHFANYLEKPYTMML